MVVENKPRGIHDGEQPPFLTEPTQVTVGGPSPQVNDRLTDLYDRFRPGFLALVIPVIAIAGAVIYFGNETGAAPELEVEEAVAGTTTQVVVTSELPASPAEEPDTQVLSAAASEPAFTEPIPADGFDQAPPPPPPPPKAKPTTPTTAAPTTAAPTTAAPTTAPPPPTDPPDLCKVRIGGSLPLRAEPRGKSDTVGEVLAGAYPAVGAQRNWVKINVGGTQGWIRAREITEITGNC